MPRNNNVTVKVSRPRKNSVFAFISLLFFFLRPKPNAVKKIELKSEANKLKGETAKLENVHLGFPRALVIPLWKIR